MTRRSRRSLRLAAVHGVLVCVGMGAVGCAADSAPAPDGGGGSRAEAGAGDAGGMCTRCGGCSEQLPVTTWRHVLGPIEYSDPPPVGGDHDPCWAGWGVHEEAVPPRNWVHNLEHGGVVYLHRCSDCSEELELFANLARQKQRTLVTPYPDLPARFALVAWGHRLLSDCVDPEAFQAFYEAHFDRGLESISAEPPTTCRE